MPAASRTLEQRRTRSRPRLASSLPVDRSSRAVRRAVWERVAALIARGDILAVSTGSDEELKKGLEEAPLA